MPESLEWGFRPEIGLGELPDSSAEVGELHEFANTLDELQGVGGRSRGRCGKRARYAESRSCQTVLFGVEAQDSVVLARAEGSLHG